MRKRRTVQVHSRAMPKLLGQERLSTLYAYHLELQTPDGPPTPANSFN
jgi:hypothetical protein